MIKQLQGFLRNEAGSELAEYALAVALLSAIAVIVYNVIGQSISDANSDTGAAIKDARNNVTVTP